MAWLFLMAAGLTDVAWTTLLKMHGLAKPFHVALIAALVLAIPLLVHFAMKTIPLGTAYAVWMGIGTVGTFLIGVLFFQEGASWSRILCVSLILAGIIGLKFLESRASP